MISERIPRKFGFNPSDIQVLTPMNRGIVGTAKLNEALQDKLNPSEEGIVRGGKKYRIGDKVMQIRNNYDKNVYNGDIGYITDIDAENQMVHVSVDDNDIAYEYSELDELVPAYAVSIHKSQGSIRIDNRLKLFHFCIRVTALDGRECSHGVIRRSYDSYQHNRYCGFTLSGVEVIC